ncbi:Uncharacterised protein [Streptococcus pneumoniae]|nr:Uncharacterised protein [Streptococcus pneumoniae]CIV46685.1 Uncharacterised protein [Streptococcus pneumoniae]
MSLRTVLSGRLVFRSQMMEKFYAGLVEIALAKRTGIGFLTSISPDNNLSTFAVK